MNSREHLLAKSEGVKDCVKWLKKRIETKKRELDTTDWWFEESKYELEKIIKELIEVKIGLEKYSKKLKHEANEV